MALSERYVTMVGAFPPPLHGMSAVNNEVRKLFAGSNVSLMVIDVSGGSLNRNILSRIRRISKIISGLIRLLFCGNLRNQTLYISVSGGLGQIYEIWFICLARMYSMRIYLHHHSSEYLDRDKFLTCVLTRVSGANAVHITQCKGMSKRLQDRYISVKRTVAVSNVVYLLEDSAKNGFDHELVKTIGFISNVAPEKGIMEFLCLVEACEKCALNLTAKIAGPFQDRETEKEVISRISDLKTAEYVGPKYKSEKEAFYNSIDILIFPTLYRNETEGIVNHEAMSRGVPIIAYGRGCIPEFLNSDCGLIIDPDKDFVSPALEQIKKWLDSPGLYKKASIAAKRQFLANRSENEHRWNGLAQEILNKADELS